MDSLDTFAQLSLSTSSTEASVTSNADLIDLEGRFWFLAVTQEKFELANEYGQQEVIIIASDACEALSILKQNIGGWKPNKTPSIRSISSPEFITMIVGEIRKTAGVSLEQVLNQGYFLRNRP